MALQMNYNHPELGIIYNAYWRINPHSGIIGGKDVIKYTIEVFKDAEMAHKPNAKCLKGFTYSFVPNLSKDAPNIIEQAYAHAKATNFNGSINV